MLGPLGSSWAQLALLPHECHLPSSPTVPLSSLSVTLQPLLIHQDPHNPASPGPRDPTPSPISVQITELEQEGALD